MTEDVLVDLHRHGEHAAAEAGDFADREESVGRGIAAVRDVQMLAERLVDVLRALHIAGGSDADLDLVFAARGEPERLVEARHTVHAVQRHVQALCKILHRLRQQAAVAPLKRDQLRQKRVDEVDARGGTGGHCLASRQMSSFSAVRRMILPLWNAGTQTTFLPSSNLPLISISSSSGSNW